VPFWGFGSGLDLALEAIVGSCECGYVLAPMIDGKMARAAAVEKTQRACEMK
jgi:hypothetical protein